MINDSDGYKCSIISLILFFRLKKEELSILEGKKSTNPQKAPDVWLNFYDRLKDIKVKNYY